MNAWPWKGRIPVALLQPLNFVQTPGGGKAKDSMEQPLVPTVSSGGAEGDNSPLGDGGTACFELPLRSCFTDSFF